MKPIEISKILRRRAMLWFFASTLLFVCAGVLYLKYFQNNRKAEAAYADCDNALIKNCTIRHHGGFDSYTYVVGDNSEVENSNLTIPSNVRVVISGKHKFNSLTINGGSLTHDPLIAPIIIEPSTLLDNDFYWNDSQLTLSGQMKKIDIEVISNISFLNGGRISANGKGYPGSDGRLTVLGNIFPNDCGSTDIGCGKGYGPGGGGNADRHKPVTRGGGGGHYGIGGEGVTNDTRGRSARGMEYNSVSTPHGSGGGAARRHHNGGITKYGAAGGGYINIIAGDIITDGNSNNGIFANGDAPPASGPGLQDCSSWASCAGAGSGGTVRILLKNHSGQTGFAANVQAGRADYQDRSGGPGEVSVDNFLVATSKVIRVEAKGGDGGPDYNGSYSASSGGGGLVQIIEKKNYTIKKWLTPVDRAGSGNSFDPYALRLGDVIDVHLTVNRLTEGTVIKDDFLSNGSAICRPAPPADQTATSKSWLGSGSDQENFGYRCVVQKK